MILILIIAIALATGVALTWRRGGTLHDFNKQRTVPLRGIAALMIVVYHVAHNVPEVPILNQSLLWGDTSVCLFFFLSGYGLMVSYLKKQDTYLRGFLGHRLGRLLPPFLIAAIGYEIYQSTQTGHSTLDSLAAIAHGGTVLPDSWFVITIFVYYLLFYACARLLRSPLATVAGLWVASAGYIALLYALGWDGYWYKTVLTFNIGATYSLIENKVKSVIVAHPPVLTWGAIAIALSIVVLGLTSVMLPIFYLLPLLVVAAVYAMGMWRSKALVFLGTISYEIYIMQCIWRHTLYPTADFHWSVYLIATITITILTAWLLHLVCKRFIYRS